MAQKTVASAVAEQTFYNGGIATVLERQAGYASVLLARNVDDLFERLSQHSRTDLMAIDILLPDSQRAEIVQHIRACYPDVLIAVLSNCEEQRVMMQVVADGVQEAPMLSNGHDSHRARHAADEPSIFLSPAAPQPDAETELDGALAGLTQRQQQVIRLLTRGYSNKVIARELGISPSTVKVHVHAAFRALGVHSRMGAAAALRQARGGALSSA